MTLSRTRELLIGRLRRRKTRQREGLFLAEGLRGALGVLASGTQVRFAVCSPRLRELPHASRLLGHMESASVEMVHVSDDQLRLLADTETPQGILLVCEQPDADLRALGDSPARILILDALQDPGNLGTLIRTAAALELAAVITLDGCVDAWSPKAVRAAAGASGRLPVIRTTWPDAAAWLERTGTALLAATAVGTDIASVRQEHWALVIGNEGAGPRPAILETADAMVSVPIALEVESLNAAVAGAILMYALSRHN